MSSPRDAIRAFAFGDRAAVDLLRRKRRGVASLAEMYAGTLRDADLDALARRFVASPHFAAYGEAPDRTDQRCIEDAFYRFLCDEQLGDPDVRRVEFLDAMIRALAVQPRPAFVVPSEISRTPTGYLAVTTLAGRRLAFATSGSRVLRGPAEAVLAQTQRD